MNSITYQVGDLLTFDKTDPEVPSLREATTTALRESEDQNSPIGVWTGQQHGSALIAIAYQGYLFSSTH